MFDFGTVKILGTDEGFEALRTIAGAPEQAAKLHHHRRLKLWLSACRAVG